MVKPATDKVISETQKKVLSVVFKHLNKNEALIFLFGSQVTQDRFGASDIDVGLIYNEEIASGTLSLIKDEINQQAKTLREIDIIDFSAVDDKGFLKEALRRIEIWHQTKKSKTYLDNLKKRLAV